MELWELNACIAAYNVKQRADGRADIALCWQTASFTGAAFGGKLKPLLRYMEDSQAVQAPQVTREEFEKIAAAAERRT